MKKLILLFAAIFSLNLAHAQIPNAGFESWTNMGTYDVPDNWGNLNPLTAALNVFTCKKGTIHTEGAYCLQLTSKPVTGMGIIPGIAVSGVIDMTSFEILSGFPMSSRPQNFTGSWQYMAFSANDQGFMAVTLTRWDNVAGERDTIGALYYLLPGMVMSWADFSLPFTYYSTDTPDTCMIYLASSGSHPANGSYLYLDKLAFSGSVGIQEIMPAKDILVSPNPSMGQITINTYGKINGETQLLLLNSAGKLVASRSINCVFSTSEYPVDWGNLAAGTYFLKISHQEKSLVKKLVIR